MLPANFALHNYYKMEQLKTKLPDILDSECFGERKRQYFFDLKKTRNNKPYLRITRRDEGSDQSYCRTQIIFFEEDISFFVEALSMLLGRFSHGQTPLTIDHGQQ